MRPWFEYFGPFGYVLTYIQAVVDFSLGYDLS